MIDVRIPRFLRTSLFDDPDENAKLAAFRARAFATSDVAAESPGAMLSPPSVPEPQAQPPAEDRPVTFNRSIAAQPSEAARIRKNQLAKRADEIGDAMRANVPRVARDLGVGVAEAPFQILAGAADAGANLLHLLDPVADLADKYAVLPRYEDRRLRAPESKTGALVRDTARFLVGYMPLVKWLKPQEAGRLVGASTSIAAAAGSEALTRHPLEENLSNLVAEHSEFLRPVAQFFASDPSDPQVIARLKKGIEGALLAAKLEGLELMLLRDGTMHAVQLVGAAKRLGVTTEELLESLFRSSAHAAGHKAEHDFLDHHPADPAGSDGHP